MRRFHRPDLPPTGDVVLAGDEGRHLARVLRARTGDEVLLFDGAGREVRAVVTAVERDAVGLTIAEETNAPRPGRDVVLCTALPKGQRMEWLVEKATEAGAGRIVPVVFARSARREAGSGRVRRWRRSALAAAKQCGRADVPEVTEPLDLDAALRATDGMARCVALPGESARLPAGGAGPIAVFVGPEGGFTEAEQAVFEGAGARPFGLGALVLRIETAAVVAVHRAANPAEERG